MSNSLLKGRVVDYINRKMHIFDAMCIDWTNTYIQLGITQSSGNNNKNFATKVPAVVIGLSLVVDY